MNYRAIISIFTLFSFISAAMILHTKDLQKNAVIYSAMQSARLYSNAISEFRTIYTSKVVSIALKNGLPVSHDYHNKNAIPTPASLTIVLGNKIGEIGIGEKVKLSSPYAFPWRKKSGGLKDEFSKKAWRHFSKNKTEPYIDVFTKNGNEFLRYATADTMRSSCIVCHNSHKDSPKTNWKVGDVRGILDVEIPLENILTNTDKDLAFTIVIYIVLAIMGVLGLVFIKLKHINESKELLYQAHHDQLTDLPNRLLCNARMEHVLQFAKRNKNLVGILFLDLDMFKNVNDSMGHAKGDYLLQQVGKRINDSVRSEDTVARLGGDEFVIIIGSLKNTHDATLVAENTLALFSKPFLIDEDEIFIGASIGISIYPNDGGNPDLLLSNADAAMYRAKSEGRNNYQFYTPELTTQAFERLNIESSLRQALEKNELCVYYQPQYSLSSEKIIGVEALVRWKHPTMGMVAPDKFIPVAEETGLIIPIGEWVLETACRQLKKWMDAGHPAMRMAVNLSARQFGKSGLEKVVKNIIEELEINPKNLELELTESIIMNDTSIVSETLEAIHDMGVGLSIDDFGTGYSSLSYIQRFPLDRLKIDRSFVRYITTNVADAEMIVSIIALGHSMKLQVLAEGVETKDQLLYLQEQGCDEAQGFYFSRPISADEMEVLLKRVKN